MKKILLTLIFLGFTSIRAQAVSVSDIDTIYSVANHIMDDARALLELATIAKTYKDNNYQVGIVIDTQAFTLSAGQKAALLSRYLTLKAQLETHVQALPQ